MDLLLRLAKAIDKFNDKFAWGAEWAVIASCFISATNAFVRYLLDYSSNGFLEIQWYLFAACVMFGAAQVLRVNEHVRGDVLYGLYRTRLTVSVHLLGLIFFLMPVMVAMLYYAWPLFVNMYVTKEMSSNAGGVIRWAALLTPPLGVSRHILQR